MDELKYWVALSAIPQLGAARFRRLESYFGELEGAWRAGTAELRQAGLDARTAQAVAEGRHRRDPDEVMATLDRAGISAMCWHGDGYPPRLKRIPDPPPVLYYLGEIAPGDECSVAVVGTRRPTSYGRDAASRLSRDLAGAGITVVSGLALGIDGVAHQSALDGGGRTIAVVAGGLDSVYPKEHTALFRRIQSRGAVVSEHPPGMRPDSRNFPRRNRLISGMTLGTVVVEADEVSGARWTVYSALKQDREVFCVPGSIFSPASRFTNRMIKEGAKLVVDYTDILEELNLPEAVTPVRSETAGADAGERENQQPELNNPEITTPELNPPELNDEEAALLSHLADAPVHVDELCRRSGRPIAAVTSTLTLMELKGIVEQAGSMHYVKAPAAEVNNGR